MANPKTASWYTQDGGLGLNVARQVVTFDGTAGAGEVAAAVPLFTVTGAVLVRLTAICATDLTEAAPGGATISVGTAGATAGIIAVTNALDIDAGEIWFAAAPATVLDTEANAFLTYVIGNGADIIGTVAVANIDGGVIAFTAFWTPLTAGASVAAV